MRQIVPRKVTCGNRIGMVTTIQASPLCRRRCFVAGIQFGDDIIEKRASNFLVKKLFY
jgi:hypothetical protein